MSGKHNFIDINCPVCNFGKGQEISKYINKNNEFLSAKLLVKCNNCSLIFAYPLPDRKEIDKYYQKGDYYENKNPFEKKFFQFTYNLALSRLALLNQNIRLTEINRILDIGAGNGAFGKAVKEQYPNIQYDIVEPDREVREAKSSWVAEKYNWLNETSSNSYDVVSLFHVLEHVSEPLSFLEEISERIKNDGVVYLETPHRDDLFKADIEPHLLFLDSGSLKYLLQKKGFEILFCDTVGMKWKKARKFFGNQALAENLFNPWFWITTLNDLTGKVGITMFNEFNYFESNKFGGERQWLRCIARKKTS